MKSLYLMRHAKSSWKEPRLADHERPLNKRGKTDAPEMGRRLKDEGLILDVIVSSDAKRAMNTAFAVADVLGLPLKSVRREGELYHASPDRILGVVHRFDENWRRVMVVGHNPGLTELAQRFYPEPIANVPTAGIVALQFEIESWRRVHKDRLVRSAFDYPKNKSPR